MARPGSVLDYPRRKEVIRFIQTAASSGGEAVEMEVVVERRRRAASDEGLGPAGNAVRDVRRDGIRASPTWLHRPGYADPQGNAKLVRMAVVMRKFREEWTPEFLPAAVRAIVLPLLGIVGRLRGYRWWYPEFSPDGPVELPPSVQSSRDRPGSGRRSSPPPSR